MDGLGKKSTAYFCYLIVNIWWYLSCFVGILFPPLLAYEYLKGTHPDSILGINLPLRTDLVEISDSQSHNFLEIRSVTGSIDFDFIIQTNAGTYFIWSIFICLGISLFLIGLYQLRTLLKNAVNESVFSSENVRRIKIIALLLFIVEPLQWLAYQWIYNSLGSVTDILAYEQASLGIEIPFIGSDWVFIVLGLLVYTLAAIFEKGHKMYEEQKLTV